ncbi:tyrosine-type recombinase/integrase [Halalkalibacterium ligniniphilum]|uniref:tyrosine-type recombinase/integrase n=1 Tax=Halalkalibacterium ligniniphilum TaxID=1134413 RepID=UPI00036CA623|nr:tyrosine-type recombinase/integrase [Halalkalibacterium ligniniphilum]
MKWIICYLNEKLERIYLKNPELPQINVHVFRHTHASLLLVTGASIKDVQARLGHTDIQTNRVIPIHKKIHHLIEARMDPNNEYLVTNHENQKMSYYVYYHERWKKVMEQLELEHRPHDCRHTFATLMDNAGANKLSIKRIIDHASKDITDKVYTHKDIEQLLIAIDTLE